MKRNSQYRGRRPVAERDGAMLVMVVAVLVILFASAAFAIDVAYMHSTRAELRTATDAAARAATEALGRLQNENKAIDAARQLARANTVGGAPLLLDDSDIILGTHVIGADGKFTFVEGGQPVNSVRVIGRRTENSPSGPVSLFFGPLFGVSEFQPVQQATTCRLDRDIALVLDISGSMNSFGRFNALKNALAVFLKELESMPQEEFVSLSVYSSNSRKLVELTTDFDEIRKAFSKQKADGRTAIGLGLRTGLDSILNDPGSRSFACKEIILMTDGNHNTGIDPRDVAPEAAAAGVTVHTITFSQGANQDLMKAVAEITGGAHLHADTDKQLIEVFREIALQIPVILID
jgi:uncharacterized protein YegL